MKKEMKNRNLKEVRKKLVKQAKGITLVSLVVTIIILLILAGVTLSLTLGDRGIITQAQKAKEAQEIATIKEDMQLAILDKELEKGGTGLTKEELEEIAGNYGELQEDGNTIKTDEGYEIKIDEIYNQGGGITGGDAATDEEIANLQQKVEELEKTVEDLNNTKTELEGTIEDLNNQIEQEKGNSAVLQEQVDSLTQQVDNLNKTIEEQENTIENLTNTKAELEATIADLNKQIEQEKENSTKLQQQVDGLTGQVDSLNKTKEQLENTINSLNTQIAELQKKQATGTAVASDVLSGKTFSNSSEVGLTGTMTNRGAVSQTLNAGGSYTIPAGYHNGSGKVTANSLASQTSANAGAGQILNGYTAWVNGSKVTGTMPNLNANSKITHTTSNGTKVILGDAAYASTNSDGVSRFQIRYNSTAGYIPANTLVALEYAKVASAIGLTANKIVAGNTILGIAGTDKGYTAGYNAGVTAADNRANANSTNYKTGYNNGYNAGVSAGRSVKSATYNVTSEASTSQANGHNIWRVPIPAITSTHTIIGGQWNETSGNQYKFYMPLSGNIASPNSNYVVNMTSVPGNSSSWATQTSGTIYLFCEHASRGCSITIWYI